MKGQTMTMTERIAHAKALKERADAAKVEAAKRAEAAAQREATREAVAAHTYQGGTGDSLGFLLHLYGVGRGSEAHNAPR